RVSRGLCLHYAFDGRFELARRAIDWVVDELEGSGEHERLADLYVNARWVREAVLALADDLDAAERSAAETYELAGRVPNRTMRSAAAGTLGDVAGRLGDSEEAEGWYRRAIGLAEAIGARSALAIATLGAAELAAAAGTHPPSAGQLEQALAICRALRLECYRPRLERVIAGAGAAVVAS